ncbi:MAG: sensor domain-containing diguanylate cyclase [Candidatus Omnitrophica bacterium]|nr:sensor domain-containing diguanylate cyclase [Candidatus Omnitrophota bacterium]
MTQKLKTQLLDFPVLLIIILLIPLVGFFIFAIVFEPKFFIFLAVGMIICILYLLILRNRLIKKQSEIKLWIQNYREQINLVEASLQQEQIAIESFREKIINYSQLKGLTERLSMCLTLEDTSKTFSAGVNRLFGDKDTTIILYLFHSKTGTLGISSSQKGQMRINIKSKKGDVFDQWIVKTMQPLLIEDTKSDYRFDVERIVPQDARDISSLISVPLMVGNKALGILRIDSPRENNFTTEDLRFLTTIGDLGAVAIENAQLYERVEQLAIKDGLTGLYLRRYLLERMPEEISRQLRRKKQLAFLMFDLDKFKQYNDKFGHIAGDIVLRTMGMLLTDLFNEPGMLICRYGGEEFSVLLPDCTQQRALELAEEARRRISEQTIILRREKTRVTVSIGVAVFPKDAQNPKELIHKADQALYLAKEKGRNRVCVAS